MSPLMGSSTIAPLSVVARKVEDWRLFSIGVVVGVGEGEGLGYWLLLHWYSDYIAA